ncbi:mycofactocin-coupled SDR family oxidoreductase [Cryptosporangium phraense]|uniref:NAD(P)-dependent oxidoreductase n=1 Tax=Cryptosporangium phraense TaxID=2593070 RepID=A0A545APY7_9ACTN|nr:mycofactocin-coupled SDR family oxidoreductase [Cryptosporangium phraense]TQS43398.1 NAD(P)-dependent oxidoreductase [Cryptosporangium phraense]
MTDLTGQVALVTGAARGQGRAHALALAAAGADVVVVDVCHDLELAPYPLSRPADLAETAEAVEALDRRVVTVEADVRSQADLDGAVQQALAEFGRLDVLVANAGIWALGALWELTENQWNDMIDVNLSGAWRSIKAVAPTMIAQGSGSIVVTSSVNGLEPGAGMGHYVAAKHGVIGLVRNAAIELGPHNVRCNAVCPGIVDTKMNDWPGSYDFIAGGTGGMPEDRERNAYHWSVLAGRGLLDPASISPAVVFLASDAARDITGVALPVDGGHGVLPGHNPSPVRP